MQNSRLRQHIQHGQGEIYLVFFTRDGTAGLEAKDQGPGFPATFDAVTAANTGLELVQALARHDLQGEARFENRVGGGAQVVVEFLIPISQRTGGEE